MSLPRVFPSQQLSQYEFIFFIRLFVNSLHVLLKRKLHDVKILIFLVHY